MLLGCVAFGLFNMGDLEADEASEIVSSEQ